MQSLLSWIETIVIAIIIATATVTVITATVITATVTIATVTATITVARDYYRGVAIGETRDLDCGYREPPPKPKRPEPPAPKKKPGSAKNAIIMRGHKTECDHCSVSKPPPPRAAAAPPPQQEPPARTSPPPPLPPPRSFSSSAAAAPSRRRRAAGHALRAASAAACAASAARGEIATARHRPGHWRLALQSVCELELGAAKSVQPLQCVRGHSRTVALRTVRTRRSTAAAREFGFVVPRDVPLEPGAEAGPSRYKQWPAGRRSRARCRVL